MRVLHIDSGREMRGGQRQVLSLLMGMERNSVLLARKGGPLLAKALELGLDARPLSWGAAAMLSRQSDLTHVHDARSHTMAAMLGGSPPVVSRRVAFPIGRGIASRWKYRRAGHFIAISQFVRRQLLDYGADDHRISVVPDGVPIPLMQSTRMGSIIAVKTADPLKGSDLVERAKALGGFEVRYSSDLDLDLSQASLLVYISRSEGLGSAALLAMAYGVPVVASRVGGLPEVVIDGETGVLTDNNPAEIADAVAQAMMRVEALGGAARRRAIECFSVERMVEGTRRVYEKVVAQR